MERGLWAGVQQGRRHRKRLYPRMLEVLRRLDHDGARLAFGVRDGKHRINGGAFRRDVVQPRTMSRLFRNGAVQKIAACEDLAITDEGRRLVRKYSGMRVEVKARRVMESTVKTFERRVVMEAFWWNGANCAELHEFVGAGHYRLEWNHEDRELEAVIVMFDGSSWRMKPRRHVITKSDLVMSVIEAARLTAILADDTWAWGEVSRPLAA